MGGALKTLAGHKGSGLALLVQVLAGTLVGAASFDNDSENAGNLVMAINPNIFLDESEFKKNVSNMITKIKSARKLSSVNEIMIPGERGNKITQDRLKSGEIEVEDNLLNKLREI